MTLQTDIDLYNIRRLAIKVFGSGYQADTWLNNPSPYFHYATPRNVVLEGGYEFVVDYLINLEVI